MLLKRDLRTLLMKWNNEHIGQRLGGNDKYLLDYLWEFVRNCSDVTSTQDLVKYFSELPSIPARNFIASKEKYLKSDSEVAKLFNELFALDEKSKGLPDLPRELFAHHVVPHLDPKSKAALSQVDKGFFKSVSPQLKKQAQDELLAMGCGKQLLDVVIATNAVKNLKNLSNAFRRATSDDSDLPSPEEIRAPWQLICLSGEPSAITYLFEVEKVKPTIRAELFTHGLFPIEWNMLDFAAISGSDEGMKKLEAYGVKPGIHEIGETILSLAVLSNNLSAVKHVWNLLVKNSKKDIAEYVPRAVARAVATGNDDILHYLLNMAAKTCTPEKLLNTFSKYTKILSFYCILAGSGRIDIIDKLFGQDDIFVKGFKIKLQERSLTSIGQVLIEVIKSRSLFAIQHMVDLINYYKPNQISDLKSGFWWGGMLSPAIETGDMAILNYVLLLADAKDFYLVVPIAARDKIVENHIRKILCEGGNELMVEPLIAFYRRGIDDPQASPFSAEWFIKPIQTQNLLALERLLRYAPESMLLEPITDGKNLLQLADEAGNARMILLIINEFKKRKIDIIVSPEILEKYKHEPSLIEALSKDETPKLKR